MMDIRHIDKLQDDWGVWADSTFGLQSGATKQHYLHLLEEVVEAYVCPEDVMEYADVIGMLFEMARCHNISASNILMAYEEKFHINKKRKWNAPDEKGIIRHKKEDK